VRSLGADDVIDYTREDFSTRGGFDVVLDGAGGDATLKSLAVLRRGGFLASIAGPVDQREAARLGVRAAFVGVNSSGKRLADLARMVDSGRLKTLVSTVFPLRDAAEALALSRTGHVRGKIVLDIQA
jgi:NADPH:quinone reductase-like Zn-dependent oxidoreductase